MKRATIKDIATMVGVSVSTVSRALRDHPDIGEGLRNKIKELAQVLNYHPNMMAVQLRKQKSNTIGLIYPEAHMFFFPSIIKGISEVVQKAGYKLLVLHSSESYEREVENVRICLENGVGGLFISLTNETKDLSHLDELKEAGIPVLLVDKVLDTTVYDGITIDDKQATQICIEHLINTGCKRILGLFGNPNLLITHKRLAGFTEIIHQYKNKGICADYRFVGDTFSAWALVEEQFPAFKPDAIFAMSDEIIAGVIPALRKMKVAIPDECSVIGISDGYLPKILDPQVTFLHHNGLALGKLAANHLIETIKQPNKQNAAHQLILPVQLIIGNSTKS
jgi:LacI family transcriptional regulator